MAELTECRNTPELHTGGRKYNYRRTAGSKIFAGALVGQNPEGLAVPAADAVFVQYEQENVIIEEEKIISAPLMPFVC